MTYRKYPHDANTKERTIIDIENDLKRLNRHLLKVKSPQAAIGLMKLREILLSWQDVMNA